MIKSAILPLPNSPILFISFDVLCAFDKPPNPL